MFKYAVACALATVAFADHPAPSYKPAPSYHPVQYDASPKPYAFEYGVKDGYSGATFSQAENSDANVVSGSYSVLLPDGRTQTVTYTADPSGYGGYVADVQYEGVAQYPEYKPSYKPTPVYHPAPVYHA